MAVQVSIETLAQLAHYHPNYFINAFKQFTGYSPVQYMNHLRSEKAKDLLLTTELNVHKSPIRSAWNCRFLPHVQGTNGI